jgi:hypothetical protein
LKVLLGTSFEVWQQVDVRPGLEQRFRRSERVYGLDPRLAAKEDPQALPELFVIFDAAAVVHEIGADVQGHGRPAGTYASGHFGGVTGALEYGRGSRQAPIRRNRLGRMIEFRVERGADRADSTSAARSSVAALEVLRKVSR